MSWKEMRHAVIALMCICYIGVSLADGSDKVNYKRLKKLRHFRLRAGESDCDAKALSTTTMQGDLSDCVIMCNNIDICSYVSYKIKNSGNGHCTLYISCSQTKHASGTVLYERLEKLVHPDSTGELLGGEKQTTIVDGNKDTVATPTVVAAVIGSLFVGTGLIATAHLIGKRNSDRLRPKPYDAIACDDSTIPTSSFGMTLSDASSENSAKREAQFDSICKEWEENL